MAQCLTLPPQEDTIEGQRPLPSQDRASASFEVRAISRSPEPEPEPGWVTVRRAESVTGVPASTLRNWARKGRIASRMDESGSAPRRLVRLEEVEERARRLGRHRPDPPERKAVAHDDATAGVATHAPEGQMLVPLDAWERLLMQLGNLHEAGQQLAEARERAAKAETEAGFLRERLSELRSERDQLIDRLDGPSVIEEAAEEPSETPPPHKPVALPGFRLMERIYREIRRVSSR